MSKIKLKLKQKWGGYQPGDVVQFDESKGAPLLGKGLAVLAGRNDPALNAAEPAPVKPERRPSRQPKAETATATTTAETMDMTPAAAGPKAPAAGSERKAGE